MDRAALLVQALRVVDQLLVAVELRQRGAFDVEYPLVPIHLPRVIDLLLQAFTLEVLVLAQRQIGLVQFGALECEVKGQQKRYEPEQVRRCQRRPLAQPAGRRLAAHQLLNRNIGLFAHLLHFDDQRRNRRTLAALRRLRHRVDLLEDATVLGQLARVDGIIGERSRLVQQRVDDRPVHGRRRGSLR